MSNSTSVVAIKETALLGQTQDDTDLLDADGVKVLWDWSPSWSFDEIMLHVEPFMDPDIRLLVRSEAPPSVDGEAAERLLGSAPPLGEMVLLTNDQFAQLQRSIEQALTEVDLGPHNTSVDEFMELAYIRPSGDFVAIIA